VSDVVLNDDTNAVTVVGSVLQIAGHDVTLDAADRRRAGGPAFRRALVHDENDGLTLNFAGDYPGGVTVHGDLRLVITHRDEIRLRGGHPPDELVSLADVIKTLRQEISELQAKIA
jgi:hypothetical protein